MAGLVLTAVVATYFYFSSSHDPKPHYYKVEADFTAGSYNVSLQAYVKCIGKWRQPLGGTKTIEYYVEPELYGVRLPDGSGVMMRVGDVGVCHSMDQNTFEERTGSPRLTWFKNFDQKNYAEIYLGRAAYEQSGARIKSAHGRVKKAWKNDFDVWFEREAHNTSERFLSYYNIKPAGNKVYGTPIESGACMMDVHLPKDDWKDDVGLVQWAKDAKLPSLVPSDLYDGVDRALQRLSIQLRFGKSLIPFAPYFNQIYALYLGDKEETQSDVLLRLVSPVVQQGDDFMPDHDRFGIATCYALGRNVYFTPLSLLVGGQKLQDEGGGFAYYNPAAQTVHRFIAEGPRW